MIIKHAPQSIENETNTDKLCDIDAMILEKSEELRKLCFDSSRQLILSVDAKGKENGTGYCYWNIKTKSTTMKNVDGEMVLLTEDNTFAINNIFKMANQFVMSLSNGQFTVASTQYIQDLFNTIQMLQSKNETYKKCSYMSLL